MTTERSFFSSHFSMFDQSRAENLSHDLKSWVKKGLEGRLDEPLYRGFNTIGNKPNDLPLEEKVYQAWSGYPQIIRMLQQHHIQKDAVLAEILRLKEIIANEAKVESDEN